MNANDEINELTQIAICKAACHLTEMATDNDSHADILVATCTFVARRILEEEINAAIICHVHNETEGYYPWEKYRMNTTESNRLKVFRVLSQSQVGLGSGELRRRIGMPEEHGQMGIILRGEIRARRIGRREILSEEVRGGQLESVTETVYYLTPMGRKHLAAGAVDSFAKEHKLAALGREKNTP